MENSMVRQRYTRRPIPAKRRKRAPRAGNVSLQQIIARQLIICMILLIMVGIIKNVNISATNFVTDKVKYILSYNLELKNVFSSMENAVIDIRRSIVPDTTNKNASGDNLTSADTLTSSTTPSSVAAPAISEITGTDKNTASGNDTASVSETTSNGDITSDGDTATLSSEAPELEEPPIIKENTDVTEKDNELKKSTEETEIVLPVDTVEASSSIDDGNVEGSIYAEDETTDSETGILAASSDENLLLHPSGMLVPVDGILSSVYGEKTVTITGSGKLHNGIDIKVKKESSVKAALGGKVTEVGSSPTYGNYIRIKHVDGLQTVYANCSSFIAKKGDIVEQGDVIANIGNTGAAVGFHLHFEVWKDGNAEDPLEYISVPAE